MGKTRVIAETGAGQHGVATAAAAALLGLECTVYMGSEDMRRQRLNVDRMQLLGAEVVAVDAGSRTLKDAINEAMRDWVTTVRTTHYILGSVLGPDPYPRMIRDFHKVIGEEARAQLQKQAKRADPDLVIACVGGGSNSIGIFSAFLERKKVRLVGVEAGGSGQRLGQHAARFDGGSLGILHGTRTLVLQDEDGQVANTHSVSAGLDYPAVGPEHVWLHDQGTDRVHARVGRRGGRGVPSLRAHRRYPSRRSRARTRWPRPSSGRRALGKDRIVLVNLSGRGDKDVESVLRVGRRGARPVPARRPAIAGTTASATWPFIPAPPVPPRARRGESREIAVVSTPPPIASRPRSRAAAARSAPRSSRSSWRAIRGSTCCPTWCARWSPAAPT